MMKKKAFICNDCGHVYLEEDTEVRMDITTKRLDKCCVDGCLGFNLKPVTTSK